MKVGLITSSVLIAVLESLCLKNSAIYTALAPYDLSAVTDIVLMFASVDGAGSFRYKHPISIHKHLNLTCVSDNSSSSEYIDCTPDLWTNHRYEYGRYSNRQNE